MAFPESRVKIMSADACNYAKTFSPLPSSLRDVTKCLQDYFFPYRKRETQ
jgi:hypothetical protein